MQEYEAKDLILRYLLENHFEKFVHCSIIKKDLFTGYDDQITNYILKSLVDAGEYIVKTQVREENVFHFDGHFKATSLTKSFIENDGGFTRKNEENILLIKKKEEREKLETELAKSNIKANILNAENARKNKWFTWINIAIGVLNLLLLGLQALKD